MRNSCGGLVESRLPASTRPGFVRQASGVIVNVGTGEGISVGIGVRVSGIGVCVAVGRGGFEGEQAVMVVRSANSIEIAFVA